MSFSTQRVTSDGTLVTLAIAIKYFDRSEISVLFDGVMTTTGWSWVGASDHTITFSSAVPKGVEVMLVRTTDLESVRHQFSLGAAFKASTVDEDFTQILHVAQEARENASVSDTYQDLNIHGFKVLHVGLATDPGDAVSLGQFSVHDATIIGYRDAAAVSASEAAASAADALVSELNAAGAAVTVLEDAIGVSVQAHMTEASQAEMELGSESGLRSMSPLRVKQAMQASTVTTTGNQSIDGLKTFTTRPIIPTPSMVRLNTANGYGSTNTKIRRFTNTVVNQGTDITYTDSITLGGSFTINVAGVYTINYSDSFISAGSAGLSKDTTTPTTNIYSIAASGILAIDTSASAQLAASCSCAIYLPVGAVIRAHTDGVAAGTTYPNMTQFTITRTG